MESRECDEIELDLGLSIGGTFRKRESVNNVVEDESLKKREMHALRRQEAKKKRDEKQQRKGEAKKNKRDCKREKVQQVHVAENPNVGFQPFNHSQFSYAQMQCMPFSNGYAFGPYVMPCWTPEGNSSGNGVVPVRPVACRSFVPYRAPGFALEEHGNGRKEGESSGSLKGSSSVVSDHQSSSYQGGSSTTDSGSRSSHSKPTANHTGGHHEQSATSNQASHAQMINNATFSEKKPATASAPESCSIKNEEEVKSVDQLDPSKRTVSSVENPATDPVKETRENMGKPPKPQMPNQNTPTLPQMPCVSTTGNGPNGRTITGFLYRYTKTEVSIVCSCHGTSFSPSDFILHAGGTDVTNPLRHITVIPSAFSMTS